MGHQITPMTQEFPQTVHTKFGNLKNLFATQILREIKSNISKAPNFNFDAIF